MVGRENWVLAGEDVMRPMRNIILWCESLFLSGVFLMAGTSKLMGTTMMVENFERWGYPQWFRVVIGCVETLAGLTLLVPRVAGYAAILLACDMSGAIATHILAKEYSVIPIPAALLALSVAVAYMHRVDITEIFDKMTHGGQMGHPGPTPHRG